MALADERKSIRAIKRLCALLEVRPGEVVVNVVVQTDLHATDSVGEQHEPEEPDLRVVIDRNPREVRHGIDQCGTPSFCGLLIYVVLVFPLVLELLLFLKLG